MIFEKPFVYYLAAAAPGPRFLPIRELSPAEVERFTEATNVIIQHYHDNQPYLAAYLNYRSFVNTIERLSKQCIDNMGRVPTMLSGEKMTLYINRHLFNFLSAIRTYLDHTETYLKRRHGRESATFASFKEATAKAFDSSFSYRFLSQLRNYVQHCGMPLGRMSIHIDFDEGRNPVSQSIEFLFSRDSLLSNFDGWKKVKSELEAMPEYFAVRPHVDAMMKYATSLRKHLIIADMPTVLASFEWLDHLMLEATWRGGQPVVAREKPSDGDPESGEIELKDFPVEMMELIRRPFLKHFGYRSAQFFA